MNILGLVTEYNPFHNGHLHHLNASKKLTNASHTVAVMSGHFVQRGEPAIFDKWTRAAMAVQAGVDLVLELPTVFAVSSAEYFAFGAVDLLHQLGVVNHLAFGSESGDTNAFHRATKLLRDNKAQLDSAIGEQLSKGVSYPKARQMALSSLVTDGDKALIDLLGSPNNILGLEYFKALKNLESTIIPQTITRISSDYHSTELQGSISSATAIRRHLQVRSDSAPLDQSLEGLIPTTSLEWLSTSPNEICNTVPVFPEDLCQLLLYRLRSMSAGELAAVHDVREGLENRIKTCAQSSTSLEELLTGIKSKRYTLTRVQRILIKALLGIDDAYMGPTGHLRAEYGRVLAFNDRGREILSTLRKSSKIPIIMKPGKTALSPEATKMLSYDLLASDLYALLSKNVDHRRGGRDFSQRPFYRP